MYAARLILVYADADKRAYWQYFELCLSLLRPGGVIAVDNVLFYGKVANPEVCLANHTMLQLYSGVCDRCVHSPIACWELKPWVHVFLRCHEDKAVVKDAYLS